MSNITNQSLSEILESIKLKLPKDLNIPIIINHENNLKNYMKKIGWKKNNHCFYRVELKDNIPSKFLNSSARNIKHKKNFRYYKKFIKNDLSDIVNDKEKVAIITPDVDIIPGSQTLNPAYIVFSNYEKILKWNRSLRFALAVCTLKDKFKDEL